MAKAAMLLTFAAVASAGLIGRPMSPHLTTLPRPLAAAAAHRAPRTAGPPRMFFDEFNKDVMRLIMDAQSEARNLGGTEIGTEHLLLAATLQQDAVQDSLNRGGLEASALRGQMQSGDGKGVPALEKLFQATARDELLPFNTDAERALRSAQSAPRADDGLVDAKGLVLCLLSEEEAEAKSGAWVLLEAISVDGGALRKEVQMGERELVGAGGGGSKKANSTLAQCSVDLTARAAAGLLDPCLGRDDEVRRCLQILVRRRKSNPVLIGDPGVGKTAIAEGLAQRIVDGRVPPRLRGQRLLSLELGLLVADTKYRGEFEQRLREVIDEVTASNDTILFIDELHTLVGAGAAEGAIDAANLLKPALARGELKCIGATTVAEYRRYIEKDAALERRFQAVDVPEPTPVQCTEILTGLKDRYEEHHGVVYSDDAIAAATLLADRYISDRFLPDKAIDLLDEAGAIAQMRAFVEADKAGLEVDESGEADAPAVEVCEDDVAAVVAQWTGIPVSKISADEAEAMQGLERRLHGRVIGQGGAVTAIAKALRRARVGLRDPRRPVAGMFFSGPTGVGKTELAKAVAEAYYGSERAMVRFDMSEYMEAHSVSRLTGPPPGYVGYEAGGQLTEAVRRSPHCLILMDEVEKAHPDVFNLLLQVFEDGRLTDNKGRTIDFCNAMLILTSNVGSRTILEVAKRAEAEGESESASEAAYGEMRQAVTAELGRSFRPEFLNRLDEIIVFSSLSRPEVLEVAQLMLASLQRRCEELELQLELTPRLRDAVCSEGFSTTFGARPLRRAVQRLCEDAVAEAVLDGFVRKGERLSLDAADDGGVIIENARGENRRYEAGRRGGGIEGGAPTPTMQQAVEVVAEKPAETPAWEKALAAQTNTSPIN